jgi:hypothetical protein
MYLDAPVYIWGVQGLNGVSYRERLPQTQLRPPYDGFDSQLRN